MFKARVLTSLLLVPVFVLTLFMLPYQYWAALMLGIASIAAYEWGGMTGMGKLARHVYWLLTLVTGLLLVFAADWHLVDVNWLVQMQQWMTFWGILVGSLFWLLIAPAWLATRHHFRHPLFMALIGWLVLLPMWLAMLSLHTVSPWLVFGLLLTVWIADSAAYFVGKRFGKRKLAPRISPGKTWEGVLGAWLAVTIYASLLCYLVPFDWWLVPMLWGVTVLSIIGDLLESLIKRQAELKDSGGLLPGHGGVLDRIDGLTSSLPLAALFIYFPLYMSVLDTYV
ncbi:phosphatidate cytidylyltransferase [Pseudomethylobacillus aquaticus]|uniref:Phosphatidate cytidylyltransferase n=1 Tax=Pseudomethylobacillus aquaticus TaxID=2676064 RepID=A0A3N0UYH1_9PROT|nr:phosphatidate cytidylyltransferase [Pseudomethylobacillus aquaticus]ROH85291.1 phosphatidate cytidylyltransferase [Pseudomethylobacillus aquaticus]